MPRDSAAAGSANRSSDRSGATLPAAVARSSSVDQRLPQVGEGRLSEELHVLLLGGSELGRLLASTGLGFAGEVGRLDVGAVLKPHAMTAEQVRPRGTELIEHLGRL